ncbi:MAG: cupin domain-containing protein [Planctomycetia bacterium]
MAHERVRDTSPITQSRPDRVAKVTLFETARFFCDVWVLRPGQAQAPHLHAAEDKLYQVLSGRARATSGTHVVDVGPGEVVFCPAGEVHGIEALGPEDLRLVVVMTPHPRPPAPAVQ